MLIFIVEDTTQNKGREHAVEVSGKLEEKGHGTIISTGADHSAEIILPRCDAMYISYDAGFTFGGQKALEIAEQNHIPVYQQDQPLPELHPTEVSSPTQVREFIRVIMKMYRTHLEKNADYSPSNILGTGEIGLVTRTWDKMARLMNLLGFRITISKSEFSTPKTPRNESIGDNLLDLAVYSIIWVLYRMGAWGR
jgi:hypothetical protein